VKGYNAVTGSRVKLGKWEEYLALRAGMLRINSQHRELLSNDLGAVGGLLFDIGIGLYPAPPIGDDRALREAWEADLERVRADAERLRPVESRARDSDRTHTEIQSWLRDLGLSLGFNVWIASNDRARPWATGRLGDGCLSELPREIADGAGAESIKLIDVLWLEKNAPRVAAAFEVEHTTSIYSGIVRLLDLALGVPGSAMRGLYLVAPNEREGEVRAQLARPAFQHVADLKVRYLAYGDLASHREAMARFGEGLKAVEAIARSLS
jgi:type II restriction enzyme